MTSRQQHTVDDDFEFGPQKQTMRDLAHTKNWARVPRLTGLAILSSAQLIGLAFLAVYAYGIVQLSNHNEPWLAAGLIGVLIPAIISVFLAADFAQLLYNRLPASYATGAAGLWLCAWITIVALTNFNCAPNMNGVSVNGTARDFIAHPTGYYPYIANKTHPAEAGPVTVVSTTTAAAPSVNPSLSASELEALKQLHDGITPIPAIFNSNPYTSYAGPFIGRRSVQNSTVTSTTNNNTTSTVENTYSKYSPALRSLTCPSANNTAGDRVVSHMRVVLPSLMVLLMTFYLFLSSISWYLRVIERRQFKKERQSAKSKQSAF